MSKWNKRKISAFSKKYITSENIRIVIFAIPVVLWLISQISNPNFSFSEFLDTKVLVSFVIVLIGNTIANWIGAYIDRKCEDAEKLTPDYRQLVEKYESETLLCRNGVKFPEIELCFRKLTDAPFSICILHKNKNKRYSVPSQIAKHSDWIMNAHKYSTVHNNINVRLDDLQTDASLQISLLYSKTTYFDSLITNRAMDYPWPNEKTIREIYEPGPFVSQLSQSKLSNHLGFNGFIELRDGNIIFVQRSKHLSIGKGTLGTSIGASFKAKYGLEQDGSLSVSKISNAIRQEIFDETRIGLPEDRDLSKHIFAFYRDLVEGGKPQFLFYYRVEDYDKEGFLSNFYAQSKSAKEDKKSTVIDGTRFVFLKVEDLKNAHIFVDELETANGKRYPMMPSASASIVMLLKALEN